jgi:dTDP-4-dehydrorhamnose 3,5-epimerase
MANEIYEFVDLGLGVKSITPKFVFEDDRGYFFESYNEESFARHGINCRWSQQNIARTRYGALRGLHYQKAPYQQAKMARCVEGRVFYVAVCVDKNSNNFGKAVSLTLSSQEKNMVYAPRGFAVGLVSLAEVSDVVYNVDNKFSSESESGVRWNSVGIKFPIEPTTVTKKDASLPLLSELSE